MASAQTTSAKTAPAQTSSALARKLAASRDQGAGSGRSVLGALRLAMARAAADLCDLALAVIGATQARSTQADVGQYLADDRLLVLLDGPEGQAGAACLDTAFVTALVQQQTMGQVTGPAPDGRTFTGTDAALAEPLFEAMLGRAADLADLPEDQQCLRGYRFGARVEDVRSLLLTLDADRYRVFDLTVDIAGGALQGAVCLVLPELPADQAGDGAGTAQAGPPGPRLEQTFGVMRAELTAMICRLRLPLAELSAMQAGDVIPLMRGRLEDTELLSINGQCISVGRLGQINGLRALRLNETAPLAGQSLSDTNGEFAAHSAPSGPDNAVVEPVEQANMPDPPMPVPVQPNRITSLPAVIGDGNGLPPPEVAVDTGKPLEQMSMEEAAAEISQLAGLTLEEGEIPESEPVG